MLRPSPRRRPGPLAWIALAAWLVLLAVALSTYRTPSDAELAAAHEQIAEYVAHVDAERAACFADPARPPDLAPDEGCGLPVDADSEPLDPYLDAEPYVFGRDAPDAAVWAALGTIALGLAVGLRRRPAAPLHVAAVGAAVAVLGQAVAVGSAAFLAAVAGPAAEGPGNDWDIAVADRLLSAGWRAVVATVLAALLGSGLARLARGRRLAALLVGWAAIETAAWVLVPVAVPWLPSGSLVSLTEEHGLFIPDESRPVGPADTVYGFEAGHLQATLVLAGWAGASLLAAALVSGWAPRSRGWRRARR